MNKLIKKILVEWSYRLDDGMIDLENYTHLSILREVLSELDLPVDFIMEFMGNLTESEKESFQAIKIDTKNVSDFGSKQTRDAAIKAGTHKKTDKKDDKTKSDVNVFDKPTDDKSNILLKEKDKKLNQDIKFDEENAPESVKEDNEPTDEEFANDKDIKPQEYDPDEIEIDGKKVKLPVTEEVLNSIFEQPPYKFPKKYIKTLERLMNTVKTSDDDPSIKKFTSKAGGGRISAQASELLTMMSATLSDEEANKLFEMISKSAEAQGDRKILDEEWIQASKSMREATLKNIREIHGEDAEVEFGGWDTKADVEDGVGMSNYDNKELGIKNKGFSTDTYFRVKKSNGESVIAEISNKKDLNVNLGQPTAKDTEDRMIEAGREVEDIRRVSKFLDNAKKRSNERLNSVDKNDIEVFDKLDKMSDEQLVKHLSKLPPSIRKLMLKGSAPNFTLKSSGGKVLARHFIEMKNIPLPWDTSNKEFNKKARELGFPLSSQKGANKSAIMMSYLLYADELNNGVEDGKGFEFIHNQVGVIGKEPFPKGSQRDVSNHFVENMGEGESRTVVLETIKEKLPLKSLMEGEETMALGSNRLSPEICQELFGTTDYDKVTQNLKVRTDKDGNRFLQYSVVIGGETKEIDIAHLKARGKGKGYGDISFEMSMAEDFKHKVHCANKKSKNPPKNYTDKEEKTANKLEKKYGKCK